MVKSGIAKMVAPEVAEKSTHVIVDCHSGSTVQQSDSVRQCLATSDSRLTIRMADECPQSPTAVGQPSDSSSDHHPARTPSGTIILVVRTCCCCLLTLYVYQKSVDMLHHKEQSSGVSRVSRVSKSGESGELGE